MDWSARWSFVAMAKKRCWREETRQSFVIRLPPNILADERQEQPTATLFHLACRFQTSMNMVGRFSKRITRSRWRERMLKFDPGNGRGCDYKQLHVIQILNWVYRHKTRQGMVFLWNDRAWVGSGRENCLRSTFDFWGNTHIFVPWFQRRAIVFSDFRQFHTCKTSASHVKHACVSGGQELTRVSGLKLRLGICSFLLSFALWH